MKMLMHPVTLAIVAALILVLGSQNSWAQGERATNQAPLPKDDAEKKILSVLNDLDESQREGNMNVPIEDGRLLRLLTETINAKHVVEVGTSNGYSGIWICLALKKTGGKLVTHEIDEQPIA